MKKNYLTYVRVHKGNKASVDVVIATTAQPLSFADYAAMKTVLNRGMKLVPITIRQEEDNESTTASPAC